MPVFIPSLINAINADPGLHAKTPTAQINKGLAAAQLLTSVLAGSIAATDANADGLIDAADLQKISDHLHVRANAAELVDFLDGHGNDNGTIESGFHYVQSDGGSLQFQGRSFIDTVADAIFHYGFRIENGRYFNEDGNDNELTADVSGWLNYFMNGENVVFGSDGKDELGSGVYSDYFKTARNETFRAGGGDDKVWADVGNDKVLGGTGNDMVGGGKGNDKIYGEAGNDTLYGESNQDSIYGGAGDDTIGGGADNDVISGGDQNDLVYGENGDDYVLGGAGDDKVNGDNGKDLLLGDAGRDELSGGASSDRLYGGEGNDKLHGGNGIDYLHGGAGADTIILWEDAKAADVVYIAKGDTGKTLATMDHVEGFESGSDKFNMKALGAMQFEKLDYQGEGKASCYYDGHYLRIDANGDAITDMMVELLYVETLSASDFLFA